MLQRCWPTDARVVEATVATFAAVEDEPPPRFDEDRGGVVYALRVEGRDSVRVSDVFAKHDAVSPGEVGCVERAIGYTVDRAVSRHEPELAPASMRKSR